MNKVSDKWIAAFLLLTALALYTFILLKGGSTTFIEGVVLTLSGVLAVLLRRSTEAPVAGTISGDISVNNPPKEKG